MKNVPISNAQLLTLSTDENELKMFLFEMSMRPKVQAFYERNAINIKALHESHQKLIGKYFERDEHGQIKYTERVAGGKDLLGNMTQGIAPEPIYLPGMTKELFEIEQKEWSLRIKKIEL